MRIVLDCNIWITLAINRQTKFLYLLQQNEIDIAACKNLHDEISDVLSRPKLKKYFSKPDMKQLIQIYRLTTTEYKIGKIELVVSDQKDNYLFALCKMANADYLITGDKLLLNEEKYQQTKIISFADFKMLIA